LLVSNPYEISLRMIAFAALQISFGDNISTTTDTYLSSRLLDSFVSDWGDKKVWNISIYPLTHICISYVIRYFTYSGGGGRVANEGLFDFGDMPTIRERGIFFQTSDSKSICFEECRVSLAFTADGSNIFPCFTVLVLADEEFEMSEGKYGLDRLFSDIIVFINSIDESIEHVCNSWVYVLNGLDIGLSVKVSDI
jgi:hypothetical protein